MSDKHSMLNRSLSMSDFPNSKLTNVDVPKTTLIKHFSCEQMFYSEKGDKIEIQRRVQEYSVSDDNVASLKTWALKYEGPLTPVKEKSANVSENVPQLDKEEKSDVPKQRQLAIRRLRGTLKTTDEKKRRCCTLFIILPIIFLLVAIVASTALLLASYRRKCEMKFDIDGVKSELENRVFGQDGAINKIVSFLFDFYVSDEAPEILIMAIVGGTGVGKTYSTFIISNIFPWETNIQHYVLPLHSGSLVAPDICEKFSSCGENLVILDGLVPSEASDVSKLLIYLSEYSHKNDVRVIVILVFNTEHQNMLMQASDQDHELEQSMEKINKTLHGAGLEVGMISFQPLQRKHIVQCIKEAMIQKGVSWTESDVDEVLSNLVQNTGCKGVASKVDLLYD